MPGVSTLQECSAQFSCRNDKMQAVLTGNETNWRLESTLKGQNGWGMCLSGSKFSSNSFHRSYQL